MSTCKYWDDLNLPVYLWVPGSSQVLDLWVQVLVHRYSHRSESGQNKLADLWIQIQVDPQVHLCSALKSVQHSQPLFQVFTHEYLEFWGKIFCATHCTCYGVFSIHVPQGFKRAVFVIGGNLFKYQIGWFTPNSTGSVCKLFLPASIHIRLCDITWTNMFISGNMFYGWCNIWYHDLAQIWL